MTEEKIWALQKVIYRSTLITGIGHNMIHLHRLVRQLEKFNNEGIGFSNQQNAYDKCGEIIDACRRLCNEHGKGSDVGMKLQQIEKLVGNIEIRIPPTPKHSKEITEWISEMLKLIQEIGKILKIEFREVES